MCPVCGYDKFERPPYDAEGFGGLEICRSCGYQFGVSDFDKGISWREWRAAWVIFGMRWQGTERSKPPHWNPALQIESASRAAERIMASETMSRFHDKRRIEFEGFVGAEIVDVSFDKREQVASVRLLGRRVSDGKPALIRFDFCGMSKLKVSPVDLAQGACFVSSLTLARAEKQPAAAKVPELLAVELVATDATSLKFDATGFVRTVNWTVKLK